MGKKRPRPTVTDVAAVRVPSATPTATKPYDYVISRSYAETVDLISEGPIEGIVSGSFTFNGTKNETGYDDAVETFYKATGSNGQSTKELGFLQSIYWNEVPVVDKDGFYNFSDINLQAVKGDPIGHIPQLESSNMGADQVMDLSVARSIGDRLYGPEVANTDTTKPALNRSAQLKAGTKIDKYSKTYSIFNKECTQIDVNIRIPGMFENIQHGKATYKKSKYLKACRKRAVGMGDTKASTIEYWIYYQPLFNERFGEVTDSNTTSIRADIQKWSGPIREIVTGKIDSPYIRTTKIDLSGHDFKDVEGFQGWRIRIARLTPESLTSFIQNKSFVDSIIEVYGNKLRYPYSSMVYSRFDAANFSRIPARAYDTRLLKVKVPNNYDPILRTYGRSDGSGHQKTGAEVVKSDNTTTWERKVVTDGSFWDGEFSEELQWTNNPAWCFYDLLTNPRYGLGEYISEDQVDKWALYDIAQYCDLLVDDGYGGVEPQFTMNYIMTSREEAFKVMNDLASIFRGITYYANGSIFAIQDKFKDPIFQFNNSNVIDGNFTYSSSAKRARHTVAIVRYNDKRNLYQPAVEYVEDEDAVRRYGIREIETTALGCTSRGQARRFAEWILASESQETETVSFSIGQDGAYLNPGDVIQIYDNHRNPLKYSGRTNAVRSIGGIGKVEGLEVAETKSGYTAATYSGVSLSGGSGSSLTANITVSTLGAGPIATVNNILRDSSSLVIYQDGTYTNIPVYTTASVSSSFVNPLATVTISGSSVSIAITFGGSGYSVGDALIIYGYDVGVVNDQGNTILTGGDITFQVASIDGNSITSIVVNNGGSGYVLNETVTIPAGQLGGSSPQTNLKVTATDSFKLTPSSAFDSAAYNSIILDQPLDFKNGDIYKLSLLTPTYNYPHDTTDLTSVDTNEVSRSALQTLYFKGEHARTITGDYRSDFMESGSGAYPGGSVCTEIYFNSGLNPDGSILGTGNQLDFKNYVITGYSNNITVPVGQEEGIRSTAFSGGCYSGENLIWSVEPASSSVEFISGSFENYRVINIQESEKSYSISALFYSTGKYDNVVSSTTLDSEYAPLTPTFPTGSSPTNRLIGDGTPNGVATLMSVNNGVPAVKQGDVWTNIKGEGLPPTIEFQTVRAGYGEATLIKDGSNNTVGSTIIASDDITYIICVEYSADTGPVYVGSTKAPKALADPNQDPKLVVVDPALFEEHYKDNVAQIIGQGNSTTNSFIEGDSVYGEVFMEETASTKPFIYVTIFARSSDGKLSPGIMKSFQVTEEDIKNFNYLSIVEEVNISNIKTEGQENEPGSAVILDSMEPSFVWATTLPSEYYTNRLEADGTTSDDKPHNELYPGVNSVDYRITIREYDGDVATSNNVSSKIFLEVTGYSAQTATPSFTLESIYNDPDTIISLLNDTAQNYKVYQNGNIINTDKEGPGRYIDVPESGFSILANPSEFPVRKFDIVVEAHDGAGNTSAGNRIGDNTILGKAEEKFNLGAKFDNFGAEILSPSGLFFAQTKGTIGQAPKQTKGQSTEEKTPIKISATVAYDNHYPYVAQARATNDGNLFISLRPSANFLGETRLSESQIEDVFENVRGVVWYCTTGDNSTSFEIDPNTGAKKTKYLNPAPNFVLQPNNILPLSTATVQGTNYNSGNFGLVGWTGNNFFGLEPEGFDSTDLDSTPVYNQSIVKPEAENLAKYNNLRVIRGAYVMKEEDSIEGFSIPFPVIGDANVTNVQLTLGFFDVLSLISSFDDDEVTPRKTSITNASYYSNYPDNTVDVSKIFTDKHITFSTLPQNENAKYELGPNGTSLDSINFSEAEGTPMFLSESSNLTSQDSANSFRGWAEINIAIDTNKYYEMEFPAGQKDSWFNKARKIGPEQKVNSQFYDIIVQPNDYFTAESIIIKTVRNTKNKMVSLLITVKLDAQRGGGFRNNYSVFLPDADLHQLSNPMEKNNGFFVGSATSKNIEPFDSRSVFRARRTKVARKDDRGFVIEVSAPLGQNVSQRFSTLFNFASIKFGLLVKE